MNITKELEMIKSEDWELGERFSIRERLEDGGETKYSDLIREHLGDNYIYNDDSMNDYWKNRLESGDDELDFDLNAIQSAIGETDYDRPITINGYGNLENVDIEDVISTLIHMIKEAQQNSQKDRGLS